MKAKQKKNKKFRGSKTHGWGAMKKHRGSGNRGGFGNAGSGKRGDAKKTRYQVQRRRFGKFGFTNQNASVIKPINIVALEEMAKKGLFKKDKDAYSIDLNELGFNKLLGSGKITIKLSIKADSASAKAVAKVQEAGGTVELPNQGSAQPESAEPEAAE